MAKQDNQNNKKVKDANKPNKFVLFFKKIGDGCKAIVSELKKVTWPTFGKVMAQTGVVLVVVLFFLVVLGAFDSGLNALFRLLVRA